MRDPDVFLFFLFFQRILLCCFSHKLDVFSLVSCPPLPVQSLSRGVTHACDAAYGEFRCVSFDATYLLANLNIEESMLNKTALRSYFD